MHHDYGHEFGPTMAAICKLFKYEYVHTMMSLKAIMSKLGNTDRVRTMKDAPSSSNLRSSTSNAVDDSVSCMQQLMHNYTDSEYAFPTMNQPTAPHLLTANHPGRSGSVGKRTQRKRRRKRRGRGQVGTMPKGPKEVDLGWERMVPQQLQTLQ